jgi:type III secretory pathway component EscV
MENDHAKFLVDLARDLQTNARSAEEQVRGAYRIAWETDDPEFLRLLDHFSKEAGNIWKTSYQAYQRANESDRGVDAKDIHRSLGCVLLAMKKWEDAFKEFEATAGADQLWRERVVRAALDDVGSTESYTYTKAWLKEQFEECRKNLNKPESNDALAAMLLLVREKYWSVGQNESVQSETAPPTLRLLVTPIAIEADAKLFPQDDKWEQSHPLFQKYVPEMRDRIMTEVGVRIPGIRFRPNETDLDSNSYLIMINEVPLVMGTVQPDRKFSSSHSEACLILESSADQLQPVFNPLSGEQDGAWIEEKHWEDFQFSGAPLYEYFEYIIYHLERILRTDLSPFLGVQEVHELLAGWQPANGDKGAETRRQQELVSKTRLTSTENIRFIQVLRGLVKEGTPITQLSAILESFQQQSATDTEVITLIEAARRSIKDQLPGNSASFEFLYLSPAFEEEMNRWLRKVDGKIFFAIPPEETQALLTAFRSAIEGRKQNGLAVVTRLPGIRPFFRRVIELEFPRVVVLSADELNSDLHAKVSHIVEYKPQ